MEGIDTLEGVVDSLFWFHYDVGNDVLYLRILSKRYRSAVGEETDDGYILLRDDKTDEPIGLTIVNWWARFGTGKLPDSIRKLRQKIEPWATKIAA